MPRAHYISERQGEKSDGETVIWQQYKFRAGADIYARYFVWIIGALTHATLTKRPDLCDILQ